MGNINLRTLLIGKGITGTDANDAIKILSDIHNNKQLSFSRILKEGRFLNEIENDFQAYEIIDRISSYLELFSSEYLLFCDISGNYSLTSKAKNLYFQPQ